MTVAPIYGPVSQCWPEPVNRAMKTFKQFLQENPLNDTPVEMWLRHHLHLKGHEAQFLGRWLKGDDPNDGEDLIQNKELYSTLISFFSDEMPYDVLKGDSDIAPDTWIYERLTWMLQRDGLTPGEDE